MSRPVRIPAGMLIIVLIALALAVGMAIGVQITRERSGSCPGQPKEGGR